MKLTQSNAQAMNYVRALVHGNSGIGKTTSILTLSERHTLVVAVERGLIPLRNRAYEVIEIECWEDMRTLLQAMVAGAVGQDGGFTFTIDGHEYNNIRVLAIDSLSEINAFCKRQIVEVDRRAMTLARTAKLRTGPVEVPDGIYDEQMTMEDWGLLATRMSNLAAAFNKLPCHTVWTCLSARHEDRKTGAISIAPALQGAFAASCPAYFDVVCYMTSVIGDDGTDTRVWQTRNDGLIIAKDASAVLDPFEATDWTALFKKILAGRKASEIENANANKQEQKREQQKEIDNA